MNPNEKRKTYALVNRSHQYRFIAMILTYNMIIVFFLAVFLFIPDIIKMQDMSLSIEERAMAADKILMLHSRVWPAIISLICLIGLHSFRVFHRFAGPLFRFTVAFAEVRNGNLNYSIKLRKKDLLHQEAALFNEMLDAVKEKISIIKTAGNAAMQALDDLYPDIEKKKEQDEKTIENSEILKNNLNRLIESADYFTSSTN